MPRKPFERKMRFSGRNYTYHSNPRSKRLANEKAETLRNKGLCARVHSKKSTSGGKVYAVYEARRKRKKKGAMY